MPSLGQLECHLELEPGGIPFSEYQIEYSNSAVECYVAVPGHSTTFSITLNVEGYISPGLSIYVFMDGAFQVSQNKSTGGRDSEKPTQFHFSQREQEIARERVIRRDWRFEKFTVGRYIECAASKPEHKMLILSRKPMPVTRPIFPKTSSSISEPLKLSSSVVTDQAALLLHLSLAISTTHTTSLYLHTIPELVLPQHLPTYQKKSANISTQSHVSSHSETDYRSTKSLQKTMAPPG